MCNPIAIDKAIINTLPIESFQGEIHVVDTVEEAQQALSDLCQHNIFKVYPHRSLYQNLALFYCQIFHCMNRPHYIYLFIS